MFLPGCAVLVRVRVPYINYFSKLSEKLRADIFSGGVTRLSRTMTIFFSESLENLSRARAHYGTELNFPKRPVMLFSSVNLASEEASEKKLPLRI